MPLCSCELHLTEKKKIKYGAHAYLPRMLWIERSQAGIRIYLYAKLFHRALGSRRFPLPQQPATFCCRSKVKRAPWTFHQLQAQFLLQIIHAAWRTNAHWIWGAESVQTRDLRITPPWEMIDQWRRAKCYNTHLGDSAAALTTKVAIVIKHERSLIILMCSLNEKVLS